MPAGEVRSRLKFIRDFQLDGGTYEDAVKQWNEEGEVLETFKDDQGRFPEHVSYGEIRDAVADWKAIRDAGL